MLTFLSTKTKQVWFKKKNYCVTGSRRKEQWYYVLRGEGDTEMTQRFTKYYQVNPYEGTNLKIIHQEYCHLFMLYGEKCSAFSISL